MPMIYATVNPIIISCSLCYSITVFADDLWYCPFYNSIMLCCLLYFITAAIFRRQFFPPKTSPLGFPALLPISSSWGGGGDNVTEFPTEATPWDGKGGGGWGTHQGQKIYDTRKTYFHLKVSGGGGVEAGTQRYKLTSTSVDKGLHPRVGMGSWGGGPW